MPIGGKAYYDASKDKSGEAPVKKTLAQRLMSNAGDTAPAPAAPPPPMNVAPAPPRPADHTDRLSLDNVVEQVLDLAQKVHAIATQAEAAVVRAEAAVVKAEVAMTKAEIAGGKAENSLARIEMAGTKIDAAAHRSELFANRAELAATKAGLAAGKAELAAGARDASLKLQLTTEPSALNSYPTAVSAPAMEEDTAKPSEFESPLGEIALLSRKLRSGMRQIEQLQNEPDAEQVSDVVGYGLLPDRQPATDAKHQAEPPKPDRYLHAAPSLEISQSERMASTLRRENVANGLVRMEQEGSIPRVAPFIMQTGGGADAADDRTAHPHSTSEDEGMAEKEASAKRTGDMEFAV